MNPELAADAAKEAGAKILCLMHFDDAMYHTPENRLMKKQVP
jgi:ribonuclease BN (tRNA processing enzyme)